MTTFGGRAKTYRYWWKEKRAKYLHEFRLDRLYFAKVERVCPGSDPAKVDHLMSAVLLKYGERFYAFKDEATRDAFLAGCPEATACEDPL